MNGLALFSPNVRARFLAEAPEAVELALTPMTNSIVSIAPRFLVATRSCTFPVGDTFISGEGEHALSAFSISPIRGTGTAL